MRLLNVVICMLMFSQSSMAGEISDYLYSGQERKRDIRKKLKHDDATVEKIQKQYEIINNTRKRGELVQLLTDIKSKKSCEVRLNFIRTLSKQGHSGRIWSGIPEEEFQIKMIVFSLLQNSSHCDTSHKEADIKLLGDWFPIVYVAAGDKSSIEPLLSAIMSSNSGTVREVGATVLGSTKDPRYTDLYKKLLSDTFFVDLNKPDPSSNIMLSDSTLRIRLHYPVREAAATALENLGYKIKRSGSEFIIEK